MSLYLTAVLPSAALAEEIDDIRKEVASRFNVHAALKPPVHITLFRPVNVDTNIDVFLSKLLKSAQYLHAPFIQQLENYDSFNNKTLFVNCIKNPSLTMLQKDVAAVYYKNRIDHKENSVHKVFHPHLTIAYRDVQPAVFTAMWNEFKNRKFKRSFTVDHFSLLKHDGKKWNILEEFPLLKREELTLF